MSPSLILTTTTPSDRHYPTRTTITPTSSLSLSPSLVPTSTSSTDIHQSCDYQHHDNRVAATVAAALIAPPLQQPNHHRRHLHHRTYRPSAFNVSNRQRQQQQQLSLPPSRELKSVSPVSVSAAAILEPENEQRKEPQPQQQHLVLIGGGHAHVQVLKALHSGIRPQYLQVTLIDQVSSASYSGMVPGCIAGHYTVADTQLKLLPLTQYSDINFVHGTVVDIDLQQKLIHVKYATGNNNEHPTPPIAFDALSIDIGSTSRGYTTCPGAIQYTIPTRPIDQLIYKLDRARQNELELQQPPVVLQTQPTTNARNGVQLQQSQPDILRQRRLVVIGGGIAGIELAMTITSRWKNDAIPFHSCTIIDASDTLLPNENEYARNVVQEKLHSKQIHVQYNSKVTEIDAHYVHTTASSLSTSDVNENVNTHMVHKIPYTLCIWSTGAGAHALSQHLYEHRQLDCDPKSYWIRVHPTLQSMSHPYVFAAGDCCTIVQNSNDNNNNKAIPSPPKAGVYAVRSGPILIENLTRYLESIRTVTTCSSTPTIPKENDSSMVEEPIPISESHDALTLLEYKPQDDFLKLLVCGDGTAIGFRFGLVIQGEWVFRLKDDIDQSFMKLFDVSGLAKPIYDANQASANQVVGKYNTQQYDNNVIQNRKAVVLDPYDAASLLRRTDNNVDIGQARLILSNMGNDYTYRNAVVESFFQQQARQPM